MKPIALERNCPPQFYRGGHRIRAFRGEPATDENLREPEDWLASTTSLFAGGGGPTTLPDGRSLSDAIDADPNSWLGPDHQLRFGLEPGLLVKLLDAGERLPVHSHPNEAFAARHLSCRHGKTEAWIVLDAEPEASVWLGLSEYVGSAELRSLVDSADAAALLGLLHEVPVRRGDAIVVPAGLPHAIDAGVFVIELQEPTDFSIMLERGGFDLDPDQGYLGLDADVALRSVTRTPLEPDTLETLRTSWTEGANGATPGVRSALAAAADPYFRADVIRLGDAPVDLPPGFSVLVVVDGAGKLTTSDGDMLGLASGQIHVTPHASGVLRLEGDTTVVRCQPPGGPQTRQTPADAMALGSDNRKG